MRRQAQGQMVRWVSRSAAMAAGAAALFATGCVRNRPAQPGLLGARSLVPAPYVEPAVAAPSMTVPAEPSFSGTTVIPAAVPLDEDLVMQSVDEMDEIRPSKSSPSRPTPAPRMDSARQTYSVKKGDSLWLIARRYGVSVAELTAENDIPESKVLKIGQVLKLPRGARLRDVSEIKRATPKHAATATSKPKSGAAAKPKSSAAGSTAGSPRKAAGKEPIPADGTYTIKSGDNPWDLARKFGVKHEELMQWNSLKSDTVLQVGQKIRLRGGSAESTAPVVAAPAAPKPAALAAAAPAPGTAVLPEAPLLAPLGAPAAALGPETPIGAAPAPAAPASAAPAATPGALPVDGSVGPAPATPAVPAGALDLPKKLSHSVTEGETLQIIAEMYGTTVDAIKKENPTVKTDADLQPNLKLMVPYR